MSRSAGVTIRKRRMQLEITVGKKVTSGEMDLLFGKLESHRMSIAGVVVYLVHRGSRKNFGTLDTMDLDLLRRRLLEILGRSKQVGVLLVDPHMGGAMHHRHLHSTRYARSHRNENEYTY